MFKCEHGCGRINVVDIIDTPISSYPLDTDRMRFVIVFVGVHRYTFPVHDQTLDVAIVHRIVVVGQWTTRFTAAAAAADVVVCASAVGHVRHEFGQSWKKLGVQWTGGVGRFHQWRTLG